MTIKTYYPAIVTPDVEGTIKNLEAFGFGIAHEKHDVGETHNDSIVMKDGNGNRVDVVSTKAVPRAFVTIRVNVADYEAAVAELTALGYENRRPAGVDTASSRSTMMISPQGVYYLICEHIK